MKAVNVNPLYDLIRSTTAQTTRQGLLDQRDDARETEAPDDSCRRYVLRTFDFHLGAKGQASFIFNLDDQISCVAWRGEFGGDLDGEEAFYDFSDLIQKGFKRTYNERGFPPRDGMGELRWRTFKLAKYERLTITTRQRKIRFPNRTLEVSRTFLQPQASFLPKPAELTTRPLDDLFC